MYPMGYEITPKIQQFNIIEIKKALIKYIVR